MTKRLYITPLPDAQTTTPPAEGASSDVQSSGIIEQAGLAVENVATDSVDIRVQGQWRAAEFGQKLARELRSLAESSYTALPFADYAAVAADDQAGYYELQQQDVNRAHEGTTLTYQYDVRLDEVGTRSTHWRSMPTKVEDVNTGLATSGNGLIGVPAEATKARWFDIAQGTEVAAVDSTVSAEYGDVDRYDPAASTYDNPTLLYEVSFARESPVDVRVWDDVGEANKFASYDDAGGTTYEITQWVHAFHPAFEFEGDPIADNGLLRLAFDESAGEIDADEWDDANSVWADLATVGGATATYELFDADLESFSPADTRVYTEWEDTSDGSIHAAVLSVQRGTDRAVVRQPSNGTIPGDLETMLDPIASTQTTDAQPTQTVTSRGEVK